MNRLMALGAKRLVAGLAGFAFSAISGGMCLPSLAERGWAPAFRVYRRRLISTGRASISADFRRDFASLNSSLNGGPLLMNEFLNFVL